MDQAEIKKQAKEIMDNFMEAMKDIDVEDEFVLERDACFREEGEGSKVDEGFRQRFLKNATKTRGDAVLANKGEWTK